MRHFLKAVFLGAISVLPMAAGFLWFLVAEAFACGVDAADRWVERLVEENDRRLAAKGEV